MDVSRLMGHFSPPLDASLPAFRISPPLCIKGDLLGRGCDKAGIFVSGE
jgi:hypothetical protein